jgi:hypothetical protein
MKSWMLLFLPFLFIVTSCSESKQTSGPRIQSIDYVLKENLGNSLTTFAYKVSKSTQTYAMIKSQLGDEQTDKLVSQKLDLAIEKYQSEWNANLAESYSEFLTSDELNSLYYNGRNSPYYKKRVKVHKDVGISMREKSSGLLTKIVSESMLKSFKQVPK